MRNSFQGLAVGTADATDPSIMLLAIIPGLLSIVLFVATLSLKPQRARATVLPPQPPARPMANA